MGKTFTVIHRLITNKCSSVFGILAICLIPALLNAQAVAVTITKKDASCAGGNDGSATATGSGGWAPYTYKWNTGATTATINNLGAGTYTVTVTDIDLGTASASVEIKQSSGLGVTVAAEAQICDVAPDGKAAAVPFGGTQPYTYKWSNNGTTAQITGLAAGTYTVTVTDASGCTAVGSATVLFWPEGLWLTPMSKDVTCFGAKDGMASVMVMSGTAPYTYIWSTGGTTDAISGLGAGTYTVTVTDKNGCSNATSTTVAEPTKVVATTTTTNATCGLAGSATASGSGGTAPYTFKWSTGATTPTITAAAGTYTVTVADAKNCTATATATISGTNNALNVNVNVVTQAGCTTGGSAMAVASGGSGNYSYAWDNGQTTATATNLTAGTRKVTVTDVTTGCTGAGQVAITTASTLAVSVSVVTNATCTTGGSATATASGGTAPYQFKWDNTQTTATATNLSAGPHSVTVTDATGCIAITSVNITQSQGPSATIEVKSSATCTGGGSATVTATGGSGAYIYLWDNGQTTATATNLAAGTRKVTVTDGAGCSTVASVTINQTNAPTVNAAATASTSCTANTGTASATGSNGTAPYQFKWSTGATTANVSSLAAGTYTVTLTDAAGCTATATVSIAAGTPPGVVISASSNAKCDQPGSATASVSGGAGPFTYKWDNGETTATATNLAAGTRSVTVTGANGCSASATVNIGFATNGVKIGDRVWYDDDQDGFQADFEKAGVPNVKVKLLKAGPDNIFGNGDDVTLSTKTTDSEGKYIFECVTPGTYVIEFSGFPAGYVLSDKDRVNNDCKDSDARTSTGRTDPFNVVAGQLDNLCYDAGIHTFCENVLNAGTICCDQTICEGQQPALIKSASLPLGGSGEIEYQWIELKQIGGAPPVWIAIPGATGVTYQPGKLYETAYYMRCARRKGCTNFLETNIVTITVKPAGSVGCDNFIQHMAVKPGSNQTIRVEWTTGPEKLDYLYTVQHSKDNANWIGVADVKGKHDESTINEYLYIDETPANGENFYRIKRTTTHGDETFSAAYSLNMQFSEDNSIFLVPNPIQSNLFIKNLMEHESDVIVDILTANGDKVHTEIIKKGSTGIVPVSMNNYAAGLYFARIQLADGTVKTVKLTKF